MAFSFEAMFLNDGENKELNCRLSLRSARFLGKSVEERQDIFDVVKNLYAFRSRIAHGETLGSMKPSDADKLKKVLIRAPGILKKTLTYMILGKGPKGLLNKEAIGNWWRRLALS